MPWEPESGMKAKVFMNRVRASHADKGLLEPGDTITVKDVDYTLLGYYPDNGKATNVVYSGLFVRYAKYAVGAGINVILLMRRLPVQIRLSQFGPCSL